MAEEILVNNFLTDAMVRVGAELIRTVKQTYPEVDVVAWVYSAESDLWRLTFAFPDIHSKGFYVGIQRIQAVLAQMPNFPLSLQYTTVEDSNAPLMRALDYNIQMLPHVFGLRLPRTYSQGVYIDDAYVYRLSTVLGTDPGKTTTNGAARHSAPSIKDAVRA